MNRLHLLPAFAAICISASAAMQEPNPLPDRLHFKVPGTAGRPHKAPDSGEAQTPILDQPEGKSKEYTRDGVTFIVMGGMAFENPDNASAVTVVDADDGYVYISHPYSSLVTGSWLKGKREEDHIVVDLPQLIYQEEFEGVTYDYYAYRMELLTSEDGNEKWYYPTESQQLIYNVDGDCFSMETNEEGTLLFGLCDSEGGWTGHGDVAQNYTPFTAEAVTPPATLDEAGWQIRTGDAGHFISYAADGNNIYIKGMAKDFPDSWVKGEMTESGLFIPYGQLVGIDPATQHYNFLCGAAKETFWSEEYEMELSRNIIADNILFLAQDDMLALESDIVVNKGMVSYNPAVTYTKVTMRPTPDEVSPYPANPVLNALIEYNSEWGYGALVFSLPALNKDGYILPEENLSYMVYINGDPWPLYSDEYPGLEDETWLVPYTYDDGNYIRAYGTGHNFYFFSWGFDTIGVQSVYEENGELFGSEQVYYIIDHSGIESISPDERNISATEWYNLSGHRLPGPTEGICIRLTRYDDGSVETQKITVPRK